MASSYSTNLALELIATGEQSGTWGTTTNTNLGTLIEQAISGYTTQAITDGADTTITIPNGATGVARNMFIECTGALTAGRNLVVPSNKKLYVIYNNTTGGFAVTVKVSGQTGVSVPNGAKVLLVSNGTDVVDATNYMSRLAIAAAPNGSYQAYQSGSFTPNAGNGVLFYQDATITALANQQAYGLLVSPTINEAASGTHALMVGLGVTPTFINAAATTTDFCSVYVGGYTAPAGATNASSIKINAAPTGATNNYALWAAGGSFRFDGTGPHSIGGAASSANQFLLTGAFTGVTNAFGLSVLSTITVPVSGLGYGVRISPTFVEASSGIHAVLAALAVTPGTPTNGTATTTDFCGIYLDTASLSMPAGTTNASGLKITGAPTGATNNYALWAAGGSFRFDGTGPHSIGGATDSTIQVYQRGTFGERTGYRIDTTLSPPAGADGTGFQSSVTINKAGSGTHSDFAGTLLLPPTIGAGAATLTNASTVKITGAPSVGTNQYALWVADGGTRLESSKTLAVLTLQHTNDTGYHVLNLIHAAATATNQYGITCTLNGDPNDTTRWFYKGNGGATTRYYVLSNGNVQNTNNSYGAISDVKLKENIVLAGSQWDDVKALSQLVAKFSLKNDPVHKMMLGFVAGGEYDVAAVSPGLVYETEDMEDTAKGMRSLGTVTKGVHYSIAYMKALKALGEALVRIENLEGQLARLQ